MVCSSILYSVLDATIPLLFALIALIYQLSRKFSKSHDYKPVGEETLPNLPNRWKQPLPQLVQSVFVLLTMGQYTFLFAWRLRDFVSSDQAPIYLVLDPILSFAAWVSNCFQCRFDYQHLTNNLMLADVHLPATLIYRLFHLQRRCFEC